MIKIREATINDSKGMAKVHVDTWRTTYKDIVPDKFLENLSYEKSEQSRIKFFQSEGFKINLVAEENRKIVGFASGGLNRSLDTAPDAKGELGAIYILKEYQRTGTGKKLFNYFVKTLIENNINSMVIWALEANNANEFYKKMGGKEVYKKNYNIGGKSLIVVGHLWRNLNKG